MRFGQLAKSFASMRDAVREDHHRPSRTPNILDRAHSVPQAFLAIVGKPSIVDVELG